MLPDNELVYAIHNIIVQFFMTMIFCLCLLIGQILLHHTTYLAIGIEMLPHSTLLVERTADRLSSTANGSVSYNHQTLAKAIE